MWFPDRIRHVAAVNIAPALNALEQLDESVWSADEDLKKTLAGDRPTQSLFFYSMSREEYAEVLATRPIEQGDVKKLQAYHLLYKAFSYLFEFVQEYYPAGGVFLRAQIARMPPGGVIKEHRDSLIILENAHRLHIPLITTSKLKFVVDDERVRLEAGNLYELNNQLNHWVENPKDSINRIHLILDYLPPEYNIPQSASDNFKFYIRKHRAAKVSKPSDLSVDLPKVVAVVANRQNKVGLTCALYTVDFKSKKVDKVFEWQGNIEGEQPVNVSEAPHGIVITGDEVFVAAAGALHVLDKKYKYKTSYKTPFIKNARELAIDGKFIYLVSQGIDSIIRFDMKKRVFDTVWKFYVDAAGKVAVERFSPENEATAVPANIFGFNSLLVQGGNFLVSGEQMHNLIKIENGCVLSGDQIPQRTLSMIGFNKGIAFTNNEMKQVIYMANYDYRSVGSDLLAANEASGINFSKGLCRYQKGTLLVGTQPAGVALLDMKNQGVIVRIPIENCEESAVLGLVLVR